MADRIARISEEIKKEVSDIIQNSIKDPRIPGMVSVLAANATKDLRYVKVYISVFGDEKDKKNCEDALKSAAGYIRREIGHRLNLRVTPEPIFVIDDSIEYGAHISDIIQNTLHQDN